MKCLLTLASLFMHKRGTVVLTGSFYIWPRVLHDGVTGQNRNLTLKNLLVCSWRTVSFPPVSWPRRQPFARILSEGTSCTFPCASWPRIQSVGSTSSVVLLWLWGIAWLNGVDRGMEEACCTITKIQPALMRSTHSAFLASEGSGASFPELPWPCSYAEFCAWRPRCQLSLVCCCLLSPPLNSLMYTFLILHCHLNGISEGDGHKLVTSTAIFKHKSHSVLFRVSPANNYSVGPGRVPQEILTRSRSQNEMSGSSIPTQLSISEQQVTLNIVT